MSFLTNKYLVNAACGELKKSFEETKNMNVGYCLTYNFELGKMDVSPVIGNPSEDQKEPLIVADPKEVYFDGKIYRKKIGRIAVFQPSDFKTGVPSTSEMNKVHEIVEQKIAELEANFHIEKQRFEKSCSGMYENVISGLTATEKGKLCLIQSSGLIEGTHKGNLAISQFDTIWDSLPVTEQEFVFWRAGEMDFKNRPYISATYSEEVALRFADGKKKNVHEILIRTNAKIFPMFLLEETDGEREIILKTSQIHKQGVLRRLCRLPFIYE